MLVTPSTTLSFREQDGSVSSYCVVCLSSAVLLTAGIESLGLTMLGYFKHFPITLVAKRMEESPNDHPCYCEPESMKGYNYIVLERPIFIIGQFVCGNSDRCISIDQIWDYCDNSADGKTLKDFCLSYALCRQLLERRYFRKLCPEASLLKAHDFFFKTLLPSEGDFKRAFRIIEVELGFCYDFFFTKYHYPFYQWNHGHHSFHF